MNKTVEILKKAKAILLKYDWTQGVFLRDKAGKQIASEPLPRLSPGCSVCISAALVYAGAAIEEWNNCETEMLCTLKKSSSYISIIDWNDAKRRTKEQVLALLDKTVARLEKAAP